MRVESISIKNYRSILETQAIQLSNYTVFVGKNNEGKSNLLSAINMAFDTITSFAEYRRIRRTRSPYYDFEADYPIDLKRKGPDYANKHPTVISVVFSLDETEQKDFNESTSLKYKAPIKLILTFSKSGSSISVARRKKEKATIVIDFAARKFSNIYIPAIRTTDESMRIIEEIVNKGLNTLLEDVEYAKAYKILFEMRQQKLDEISAKLLPTLQSFVPTICGVELAMPYSRVFPRMYNRNIEFIVNDGHETSIEQKGDGIKSLVQIALLRETSDSENGLIMIEEPESHLHSGAIHELRKVLLDISKSQQVIVTTHNPILVNTLDIKQNYIVGDGTCECAKTKMAIREELGIHFSDALFSSEHVVVVEGESDKKIFSHLLCLADERLKRLLELGEISFFVARGASKMPSVLSMMNELLIRYFAIWDNDEAGKNAKKKSDENGLIDKNYRFVPTVSRAETTIEDLIDPAITFGVINEKYKTNIAPTKRKRLKWSEYVINKLKEAGVCDIDNKKLEECKDAIAEVVIKAGSLDEVINNDIYKSFIHDLAGSIISYFDFSQY